ncbi:MAG: glutamate synthase, partial [Actinobacteria bacterium]|nr:glutamate synthase [Actinomycetota bacterium]
CGATNWRDLNVVGRDLKGIYQAMEYLPPANKVQQGDISETTISAKGKHVVIIGGGDTGADCLGTAIRQGATSITQLEILPQPPVSRAANNPWPQWSFILRTSSAHEEGGERLFAVSTEKFVGDENGNVSGLMISDVINENGKFVAVAGTQRELKADLVLLALGFVGPEKSNWLENLGVKFDERGNIARNDDYMSSVRGVFVAGDMGRGQSLIVWAIAEGRAAASNVDKYLMGDTDLPAPIVASAKSLN